MRERVIQLSVDDVLVQVRRSRRARRITLRVTAQEDVPELVLPRRCSLAEGREFAESRSAWLKLQLAARPARVPFADGVVLPYMGATLRVRHEPDRRGRVARQGEEVIVPAPPELLARRLEAWLKREARREITWRAQAAAARVGRRIKRISLRDPRSQWGSCSSKGTLSFSWRLVFAPQWVINYVAVHEAVHLKELNHSPRFWRLVNELCAEADAARAWLNDHAVALHRYG